MRKVKQQLERIDIDELFNNSSNRGMLSFLQRPPQEAQARLAEKQRVNEADAQRLEASIPAEELPSERPVKNASTVLPFPAQLPSKPLSQPERFESEGINRLLPDSNLLPDCDLESIPHQQRSLSDSTLLPGGDLPSETQGGPEPDSNLLPGGDLDGSLEADRSLPDSALLAAAESARSGISGSSLPSDSILLPVCDLPSETQGSPEPDCNLLPGGDLDGSLEADRSLPDSALLAAAESARSGISGSSLPSDSILLPDSDLQREARGGSNTGSSLLPGGDLRTPNGRVVRLRPARSVQDAHTNGEHLLLTAMWKKGTPESEDSRLLRAGLSELARLTGSHKTSCRAYVRALVAKLALEEAETFDAAAGSEGARVYRIFSFNTILERRRRANLTHVIRTGAVSFVNPKTGEKLTASGPLLPDSNLPTDSKVLSESNFHTDSGSNHHHTPGSNHPPLIKNRDQELSKQTSSVAIYQALSKYGPVDDDVLTRLIANSRLATPDSTEDEIIHFIEEKGAIVRAGRIHNPIGFLLTAVPKCFSGETFRFYREEQARHREREAAAAARAQLEAEEWKREQHRLLLDPNTPEDHKNMIREWLGIPSEQGAATAES